jgi:aminotransferase
MYGQTYVFARTTFNDQDQGNRPTNGDDPSSRHTEGGGMGHAGATAVELESGRFLAERARPFAGTPLQTKPDRPPIVLSQGTPDLPTPRHAIAAVEEYLSSGKVYYTFHDGMPELRAAIARKLRDENDVAYDPVTEIIVTAGAQEAMFVALFGTLDPGDEVIVPDPRYAVYDEVIQMVGAVVKPVPVDVEAGFLLQPEAIAAAVTERTKAILVISPDHPSGAVQPRERLAAVGEIARRHDLLIYADELYERFVFDGVRHVSVAALPGLKERTLTINGFSKAFAMTGWRVGYLALPAALKPALTVLKHATSICAPTPSQIAALAILEGPREPLDEMMAEWGARREYLYDRLAGMDLPVRRTPGSYYVLGDIRRTGLSSREFSSRLQAEEEVRVSPGSAFGQQGEGMVRLSFMTPKPELAEGLDRLERFWKRVTTDRT